MKKERALRVSNKVPNNLYAICTYVQTKGNQILHANAEIAIRETIASGRQAHTLCTQRKGEAATRMI